MSLNELLELTKEVFSEYEVWIGDISHIYIRNNGFIRLEIIKRYLGYDEFSIKITDIEVKQFNIPIKNTKEFLYLFKDKFETYQLHKNNLKLANDDFKNLSYNDVIRNIRDKKLNEIL